MWTPSETSGPKHSSAPGLEQDKAIPPLPLRFDKMSCLVFKLPWKIGQRQPQAELLTAQHQPLRTTYPVSRFLHSTDQDWKHFKGYYYLHEEALLVSLQHSSPGYIPTDLGLLKHNMTMN